MRGSEFDQNNVRFSVESRSPELTVEVVMERFALQPLDVYLEKSKTKASAKQDSLRKAN